MAGKSQHHIPRMLLRGFANAARQTRAVYAGRSFVSSIGNVATEGYFLGPPGPDTADESVTSEEQRIGPLLDAARLQPPGPVDSTVAATLIVHFSTRTRAFRLLTERMGGVAFERVGALTSTPATLGAAMRNHIEEDRKRAEDMIDEELAKRLGAKAYRSLRRSGRYGEVKRRLVADMIARTGLVDEQDAASARGLLRQLEQGVPHVARRSHVRVMAEQPTPAPRVARLSAMAYKLESSSRGLLLPDSVAWTIDANDDAVPLFSLDEIPRHVSMPIARGRLLVGAEEGVPADPHRDHLADAAAASVEFYVHHPDDQVPDLSGLIGRGPDRLMATLARSLDE